jgi:ubiquinone/menaquinone biosynthesis C-methylase UbiE
MNINIPSHPLHLLARVTPPAQTTETPMKPSIHTNVAPDFDAIKTKQNAAWSSGDYAKIGITLQITGEELAEAANPAPGIKVLDVAGGNGNATLAFARRWCHVTSTDYVESLLEGGRRRADADGLDVEFLAADAENLPFERGSFDMVVSTFGVMFTPDQHKSANELMRVCKAGGKIAMANWTPESFIGALFRTLSRHVPPPPGVQSPAQWGSEGWLAERFSTAARDIVVTRKNFNLRYPSPQHFVNFFRTYYGPVHKAFLALDEAQQAVLEKDILDLVNRFNVATDSSMIVPSEYAEVIVTKG